MADNITITAGAGTTLATDDIGGVHYQRVKVGSGANGTYNDVSTTNPLPVTQVDAQTWVATVDAAALAANKWHVTIYNSGTSVLKVKRVVAINSKLTGATGVAVRFDFMTISSAPTSGTDITPLKFDSGNSALSGVAVKTGSTATGVALLWPFVTANEDAGSTMAFPSTLIMQYGNLMTTGDEMQTYTLRQNEGLGIKQITSSTVGAYSWAIFFTVE